MTRHAQRKAFAYVIQILKIRASRLEAERRDNEKWGRPSQGYVDQRAQAAEIRAAIAVLEGAPYVTSEPYRGAR